MAWKPIIAAVDDSPDAARAAVLAWKIAQQTGAPLRLIHAAQMLWVPPTAGAVPADIDVNRALLEAAERRVQAALETMLPQELASLIDIRVGRAPWVLTEAADELEASLVVMGGTEHPGLGRWFGGRLGHHLVRKLHTPILIATRSTEFHRVLVGVDIAHAAAPVLEAAERFAQIFEAEVRAVHVVEPIPLVPGLVAPSTPQQLEAQAEAYLDEQVWPLTNSRTGRCVRSGRVPETLVHETAAWDADLLVIGSHGKGWVDRILLGSVTESLLDKMPTSLLVVPIGAPSPRTSARAHTDAMAHT